MAYTSRSSTQKAKPTRAPTSSNASKSSKPTRRTRLRSASSASRDLEITRRKNQANTSAKVRYALIGLGHIAQVAALPGILNARHSELRALVSSDPKKRALLKKRHGIAYTYSYEQIDDCLANPEIDAVYIALPNDLHYEYVIRAAEAGKHVLCEKPLAMNAREAEEMIDACAHYGVKLMTAYRLHYEPATLETLEKVKQGDIGEVRYLTSSFSYQITDPDNIRLKVDRGGGPVYDIGIYCLNAARMFMQDEPTEVSAMLARSLDPRFDEVEETAAITLRFPRGRLASFVVSFGADEASRLEIVGTQGRIVLEPAFEYASGLKRTVTHGESARAKEYPKLDQFGGEIEAFSQSIFHDLTPEASGEEGLADLRVIDAIFEASDTGRTVRLPAFRRRARPSLDQAKRKQGVDEPRLVRVSSPHD